MAGIWAVVLGVGLGAGCQRAPSGPAFDVPALVGQKIEAIRPRIVGPGTPAPVPTLSGDAGSETFAAHDYRLEIDYLKRNGRVTMLRLLPSDATQPVKESDKPAFLQVGKLREDDPRYALEWIEDPQNALSFAGVRIVPVPKTHTVMLRVVSGAGLLDVSYNAPQAAMTGTVPGQKFITLAPWEATFSAPTGTVVGIEAVASSSARASSSGAPGVQIVVDGKVAAQSAPSLGTASCSLELD